MNSEWPIKKMHIQDNSQRICSDEPVVVAALPLQCNATASPKHQILSKTDGFKGDKEKLASADTS